MRIIPARFFSLPIIIFNKVFVLHKYIVGNSKFRSLRRVNKHIFSHRI